MEPVKIIRQLLTVSRHVFCDSEEAAPKPKHSPLRLKELVGIFSSSGLTKVLSHIEKKPPNFQKRTGL